MGARARVWVVELRFRPHGRIWQPTVTARLTRQAALEAIEQEWKPAVADAEFRVRPYYREGT